MNTFVLDKRLATDSFLIGEKPLSQVRLMNNALFPWFLLVPKKADRSELFDLSVADQICLIQEITEIAEALKKKTGCDKINIAAFGNQVEQLHVHIIARFQTDAAWPQPVWCCGKAPEPYEPSSELIDQWQQVFQL